MKIIQWRNLMRDAESDAPEILVVEALLVEKVTLLSWAHDQAYGTDFVDRVYRDPMQFGVHELES